MINANQTTTERKLTVRRYIAILTSVLCFIAPFKVAVSNILPDADGQADDSAVIVEHIKESLAASGLVSIEQHTGQLLYNPEIAKLHSMQLKQKMIIPAMVINQKAGIKLVAEMPLSCFMISAQELDTEYYKGFRQYETLRYIRDIKGMPVSRALICEPIGKTASKSWKGYLALDQDDEPFVFEEHTSASGEKFYYFVNDDGYFEMYL